MPRKIPDRVFKKCLNCGKSYHTYLQVYSHMKYSCEETKKGNKFMQWRRWVEKDKKANKAEKST